MPLIATSRVSAATEDRPADSPWTARPLAIEAHLAPVGSPIGLAGVTVDAALASWLSLGGGAGAGLSGPQVALFGRARPWRGPHVALAIGAGLSTGKYHPFCLAGIDTKECLRGIDPFIVVWGNVDVGLDARFDPGLVFRAYVGGSVPLYEGGACRHVDCSKGTTTLPFLGASIGYAF
ncbi:MAG: hypothetical protein NVSMB47_10360 [Polyangiales bacterium]